MRSNTSLGGGVAYIAGDQDHTATLWITNTTTGNIQTIPLASYGSYSSAQGITSLKNQLFIVGNQGDIKNSYAALWITSLSGTVKKQIQLTSSISSASSIISHNNKLFITGLTLRNQLLKTVIS